MRRTLRILIMRILLLTILSLPAGLVAGSFSGAAGTPGSEAMAKDAAGFVAWANGNLPAEYGSGVDATWKTPAKAYGKATGDPYDIVCLGNGGQITLSFPRPIRDGEGADFAVFENGLSSSFLELAFVEVSSDGVNFVRFPNRSEGVYAVGGYGMVDPTTLNGLAGKHQAGYGTPFDLATLAGAPLLDRANIRFVRLVDILGNGTALDSTDHPIYDPTPTTGSGGFDLEAIGVIHQNAGDFKIVRAELADGAFQIAWESNPGSTYRIETSTALDGWTEIGTVTAAANQTLLSQALAPVLSPQRFWRVAWLAP
jgi:hypothetical protein